MIVNTPAERCGPTPPMYQPFLVKGSPQALGTSADQVEDVHAAEGNASRLRRRVEIRIVGRQRRTSETEQQQSGEEIALTREVDQKVVSEVAIIANIAVCLIETIGSGGNAVLNFEPVRVTCHIVVTRCAGTV